ncbi:hypothetical protein LDENG_00113580 [Lucifuga dentata]|nr:hypothetical protein LDENG_00113580 [Lucifuga dentata]
MQKGMYKFWSNICLPSRHRLFQGHPCIFQQDNAKPHSARITNAWLRKKRVQVLDWPACSPDLSPTENVWHIMKHTIWQQQALYNSAAEDLHNG